MILLVSDSAGAHDCAVAVRAALHEAVTVCDSIRRAAVELRAHPYSVITVEQALVEADGSGVDALLQHAGLAVPVFVNLAIQSAERVVREVRAAQARGQQEQVNAIRAALASLRSELKGDATGILVSSQMALASTPLPPGVEVRLKSVCALAERMCARLAD